MRVLIFLAICAVCIPAQNARSSGESVWAHLKRSYDADGDGVITKQEYRRGDRAFGNLDRNGDGQLSAADFERSGRGRAKRKQRSPREEAAFRLGDLYGSFINRDGQPGISKDDWNGLIKTLEPVKGAIPAKHLAKMFGRSKECPLAKMGMRRLKGLLDRDADGEVEVTDLNALFTFLDANSSGVIEQGTEIDLPPGVGELAPDFTLPRLGDVKAKVQLSKFRGKKPVILIFGSYT